jgi:hypothetical protein
MQCSVGVNLESGFHKAKGWLDKAVGERDTACGGPKLKETQAGAKKAFEVWVKAAEAWEAHIRTCEDCRNDRSNQKGMRSSY